jgi:hypothetical protein
VDVHYFEMPAWDSLYQRWIATGRCKGIWQSEIGWNTYPNFLPNTYWRVLYWSLQRGWKNSDEFKVFWYDAWRNDADAQRALVTGGNANRLLLTAHGQRLATMNALLGSSPLQIFTSFSLTPPLPATSEETTPTALGFQVGSNRVVIALILAASRGNAPLSISVALSRKPARVELLSGTGDPIPVTSNYAGGRLQIKASSSGFSTGMATYRPFGAFTVSIGYVKIDE